MRMSTVRRRRIPRLFAVILLGAQTLPSFVVAQQASAPARADDPAKLAAAPNGFDVRRDSIERGTHDELLTRGGTYARLYAAQFQDNPAEPGLREQLAGKGQIS